MRKITMLALVLLVAANAVAATDRTVHQTVALDANGRLSVDTHNGSVTVTTWNRPQADIQARIEATFDVTQSDVNATQIKISGSGSSATVSTDYSGVSGWGLGLVNFGTSLPPVHYTITIPATASLRVTTHNASANVRGLRGDLTIETHNGAVDVTDLDGAAKVESHNGDIRVAFARFTRDARIETHNGSIDVRMPQSASFRVEADGHHLDFNSDFPATTRGYDSSRFTGDVNGGGPALRISTHNGSVRLRKS